MERGFSLLHTSCGARPTYEIFERERNPVAFDATALRDGIYGGQQVLFIDRGVAAPLDPSSSAPRPGRCVLGAEKGSRQGRGGGAKSRNGAKNPDF